MSEKKPCTAPHATLKADAALFATLELIGVQRHEADESGPAEAFEVRNCGCGSTLYRRVS